MRQKLGVALAVLALALSGAREAADQFPQLKSLAGGWATSNAWNSLLVYAAGTFDGLAPRRQNTLVASNNASREDAKVAAAKRRAKRPAARRPARVKVEAAEPLIVELALGHAEAPERDSEVEEFRIEVGRDAGAKGAALVPRFAVADFETEVAREAGRARLASELPRLWGKEFTFRFDAVETLMGRPAIRRPAARRKAEERRGEATEAERDTQEVLFEAPSDSGLLNCDEEPRR